MFLTNDVKKALNYISENGPCFLWDVLNNIYSINTVNKADCICTFTVGNKEEKKEFYLSEENITDLITNVGKFDGVIETINELGLLTTTNEKSREYFDFVFYYLKNGKEQRKDLSLRSDALRGYVGYLFTGTYQGTTKLHDFINKGYKTKAELEDERKEIEIRRNARITILSLIVAILGLIPTIVNSFKSESVQIVFDKSLVSEIEKKDIEINEKITSIGVKENSLKTKIEELNNSLNLLRDEIKNFRLETVDKSSDK